jgi:hypothetical protein
MYVCMYVCMYVFVCVCMYVFIYVCMNECMYVCYDVCMTIFTVNLPALLVHLQLITRCLFYADFSIEPRACRCSRPNCTSLRHFLPLVNKCKPFDSLKFT